MLYHCEYDQHIIIIKYSENYLTLEASPSMFVNLNIPSFGELLRKFVFSFKSRIMNSDNQLVNGIVRSATPLFSKIWAWWGDILSI